MIDKRLISLVSGSFKYVVFNVLTQWIALICNIVIIFMVGDILSMLFFDTIVLSSVQNYLYIFIGLIIIRFICAIVSSKFSVLASKDVKLVLRKNIYNKLIELGPAYSENVSTSEVVQVSVEGVDQLEIFFGKYLPQLFYSLLAPITLFVVLIGVNAPSALVLIGCVPLIPISIIFVQKFAKKILEKYWGKYTTLGDSFLENIEGLTTLKIYGADEEKNRVMNIEAEEFRKVTMKVLFMQLNSISVMDIIAFGGAALGVIVSVLQLSKGNINFAQAFAIILLSSEFFIPLRLLGSYFHIAMNGMAASDKIFKLLDLDVETAGSHILDETVKSVSVNDVSYSYTEDKDVLSNVTLNFTKGIHAVIGESGSGKSTLAKILTSQNTNYDGSIKVNDLELSSIELKSLMKRVMLVSHSEYLFKGTVYDNLIMGNKDASVEEMLAVISEVRLDSFLEDQEGLDSEILENGSNLSGGQRQRLALARALLSDADVYLFDESTSNIDTESEAMIIQTIEKLGQDKIVILISHRLANVVNANNIHVLHEGVLVESGNHDTLMSHKSKYFDLYTEQMELESYAGGVDHE